MRTCRYIRLIKICKFHPNSSYNVDLYLSACHDIDQWPSPSAGETVNLPIFGTVLQVIDSTPYADFCVCWPKRKFYYY